MAETAYGTVLKKNTTTIGKIKSFSGMGLSVNMIETGNLDSAVADTLAGRVKGEPLSLDLEYEKTATTGNYAILYSAASSRTSDTFDITFADGSKLSCTGFISKISGPTGSGDSELTFTVEITPKGIWTFTGA